MSPITPPIYKMGVFETNPKPKSSLRSIIKNVDCFIYLATLYSYNARFKVFIEEAFLEAFSRVS